MDGRGRTCVGALVVCVAVILLAPKGWAVTAFDDAATFAAAGVATWAAVGRARRVPGRAGWSWAIMAAAFAAAAFGELCWGFYEVVLRRETPFPSVADLGYLAFPALAMVALLLRQDGRSHKARYRQVLDGVLVAGSLFSISWVTAMGSAYRSGAQSPAALLISLAYPVSDLVLLTVVLLVVSQTGAARGLALLAGGLAVLALADSGYTYFSASGSYQTGNLVDLGYIAAYLLLALAAWADDGTPAQAQDRAPSRLMTLLPYLPAGVAVAIAAWEVRPDHVSPTVLVGTALVVVLAVRQLTVVLDNRRLVQRVLDGRKELEHRAFHDSLTGLANRALFVDRLAHATELHRRDLRPVAVLLLDLDDFKGVNDSLGHATGDQLLVRVAERLSACTRSGDTVARLGGDEFAVLSEDGSDPLELAARLLAAFDQPVTLGEHRVPASASIGVAPLPAAAAACDAPTLLRRADTAMYAAKHAGKGRVTAYVEGMPDAADDLELRTAVAAAVAADGLDVHFQPLYTPTGRLLGFEALSRWTRDGRPVPPDVFIPAADRAGVLRQLDTLVLDRAMALLSTHFRHEPELLVAVNVGVEHLRDPALPDHVARRLAEHGLGPNQLVLEVPETHLFSDPAATALTLARLRATGVRLALDDFGVGYSTLARMQELPPDIVKIDRCFVAPLGRPGVDAKLVEAMVDLAHRTGALVIAEGIEDHLQLQEVSRIGCDAVQGFLLGRPMPAHQAAALTRLAAATATSPDVSGASGRTGHAAT